jgi:osmotically-inducible protein OsmY
MNQSLMLERPRNQTKRTVFVDNELSEAKARGARQRILNSNYAEVRCVRCEVRDGILYLFGQVTSFYLKQLTQEAVRSVEGVDVISNCVEVNYPARHRQTESEGPTNLSKQVL